jgi:Ca2+-transporting ATPase
MKLTEKEIRGLTGLTADEIPQLRKTHGFNELPASKKRSLFRLLFEIMKEPMFLLLVACGVLYLILGDLEEALLLLSFVFVIIGITLYQENKTENALEALRDLSSPRACVIRNGTEERIAGREVLPGDIILLKEGDRVPADADLLWSLNLTIDESILTGESVAVRKCALDQSPSETRPGGDDSPFVFSGTLAVQGQGVAHVRTIGLETEMGRIGKSLKAMETESTRLQKQVKRLVKTIAVVGAGLCVIVVLVYGLARHNWLGGLLSGISLAMATLPEEFPVVLTIFLAMGAWRMSKKNVLTRRVSAVETLGSATVLCSDKTGTLTQNKMTIAALAAGQDILGIAGQQTDRLPEEFHSVVEYGVLASKKDPFDPMDKALKELGQKTLYETEHLHDDWELVREYPLSPDLLALSHVWQTEDKGRYVIAAKGAPEAILDLCHYPADQARKIEGKVMELAERGLRVLGVARAAFTVTDLPESQHDFTFEFIGLVGLADPIRPTVPAAVKECYQAGIRVVMITGDYPVTAQNIARQIGLANADETLTGDDLDRFSDEELSKRVGTVNVFSRVVPEQKLRLVKALRANGEVVAMTGDGVNDAPALKASHIGVAMGKRGTDVARESADLVLLDDDFSSIVSAVRMGRRIYDNLKKAIAYIFAIHVPIAGMSLLPIILGMPVLLHPVHIVFMELIIDPACSVVFEREAEDRNIMRRKPRHPQEKLFGVKSLSLSLVQGLTILFANLLLYKVALSQGVAEHEATSMAFIALILANIGLILTNRSWAKNVFEIIRTPNRFFLVILIGAIFFLGLVIYVPFLQELFHFAAVGPVNLLIAVGTGVLSLLWFELVKMIYRRRDLARDGK